MKKMILALLFCSFAIYLAGIEQCDVGDSIYDIRTGAVELGSEVYLAEVVVTTPQARTLSNRFFVQEPEGGPYSGIYIWVNGDSESLSVTPGDLVNISGIYKEYYGLSEIDVASPADVKVVGSRPVPEPLEVNPEDVATDGPLAESHESVLLTVRDVTVIENPDEYNEYKVSGGLVVDDLFYEAIGELAPERGVNYAQLTGVLHFSYGDTKLEPRYREDYSLGSGPTGPELTATFIDVSQGDAALFELPDGEVILIDGGKSGRGNELINPILDQKGIDTIDLMVLTHPHADHCGGLDEVLEHVEVLEVWDNGEVVDTQTYRDYAHARDAEGAVYSVPSQGYLTYFGDVRIEVLNNEEGYSGENNDSLVLIMSYGSSDFLMTGDIEYQEQADLVADYGNNLRSEVLKVPHHGSANYDSSFVSASAPEIAVISVGEGNDYGDPSPDLIAELEALGATICRTDLFGTIIAATDGSSLDVMCSASE